MTQSDRTTIDVDSITIELQRLLNGEVLRGECFVDFDKIDIAEFHSSLLHSNSRCRHWPDAHDLRLHSRNAPAHDPAKRRRLSTIRCRDNHSGASIDNAARVTCSDEAILGKSCLQFG